MYFLIHDLLVLRNREIIIVFDDLLDWNEEALPLSVQWVLLPAFLESFDDIGNIPL